MRVAIIVTARPSWAKLSTVVGALVRRHVDVQIVACASALLERYGRVVDVVRQEYPNVPITECWSTYEGANLVTSAKETGAVLIELCGVLQRLRVARVVVVADRHEVLGAAQAASYLHVPTVHLQGGEHSGSIDDRVRDAITALADVHCTATERAKWRVYGLTGSDQVYNTGCPSIDLAKAALADPPVTSAELGGAGAPIDLTQPFVTVLFHPVTDEGDGADQLDRVMRCAAVHPVLALWPGQDAGAEAMSKVLRGWQDMVHTVRNLPPRRFLRLLTQTAALVGNSSAGIREASYLGVPVVNIGRRQMGRERAVNVVDVPCEVGPLLAAMAQQVRHGRYPGSALYGRGDAGERIAEVIVGEEISSRRVVSAVR